MRRLIALTLFALVACGGSPTPGDPGKILHAGGTAMGNVHTVNATLKLTKGTVSIKGFTLVSARTSVRMPTDSDTVYTVKQQDVSFALEIVIAGGHVYEHIPFTPFREVTGAEATSFPDMAKLFDASTGLPAVIPAGNQSRYVAGEQIDGKDVDHVSTVYTAAQVHSLLAYLNSSGPVTANIWVRGSDHFIPKAVLEGAFGDAGKDAAVEVDLTNFNGAVSITSPIP